MKESLKGILRGLGVACALSAQAWGATCATTWIYRGGPAETGSMDESSRTWPEAPEFRTNWDDKGNGMVPPYIRLSGQFGVTKDWTGSMNFGSLPKAIAGGSLQFQAWATNSVNLTYWVAGPSGISTKLHKAIPAGVATTVTASISDLGITGGFVMDRLWLQLDQVPASQYNHTFFDNIQLTCAGSVESPVVPPVDPEDPPLVIGDTSDPLPDLVANYPLVPLDPKSPVRLVADVAMSTGYASSRHAIDSTEALLSPLSNTGIVLWKNQSEALLASRGAPPADPASSVKLWRENLYTLAQGALRDSLFANPRDLFRQAHNQAQQSEFRVIPILVADIDYEVTNCRSGVTCTELSLTETRFVQLTLPVTEIPAIKFALVYDPYFITTNRSGTPGTIQLMLGSRSWTLNPGDNVVLEFPSAESQRLIFRYIQGNKAFVNQIMVEVAQ
jgi:hypothetical protein